MTSIILNLYYDSVTSILYFMTCLSRQQPPVETALASVKWRRARAAPPPSRAAFWRRVPPSTWSIHCCFWASCCWELQPSPYSHSVSPTLTTMPARGTHRFTLVRFGPIGNEYTSYVIKNGADCCVWNKVWTQAQTQVFRLREKMPLLLRTRRSGSRTGKKTDRNKKRFQENGTTQNAANGREPRQAENKKKEQMRLCARLLTGGGG